MEHLFDVIETAEEPMIDELVVVDELPPAEDLVVVDEPVVEEKDFDWDKNKDLKKFLKYLQGKMGKIPQHSGNTTAGCERAITYLKLLDREISKAVSDDLDCDLDDQEVETFRKDIRKMIKKLQKRHNEINEAYDADDAKYASMDLAFIKTASPEAIRQLILDRLKGLVDFAQGLKIKHLSDPMVQVILNGLSAITLDLDKQDPKWRDIDEVLMDLEQNDADDMWKCPECGKEIKPGDHEHILRHNVMQHGHEANDGLASTAALYCKSCGTDVHDKAGAKRHAQNAHAGENVSFSDMPVQKQASHDCGCEVKDACACEIKTAHNEDNCPKCDVKLWKAAEGIMECIACDEVYETAITKEASTPRIQLVMSPFERAISGIIVNAVISQGKNIEEVYASLKEEYKFSNRDELAIQQLLLDMGYNTARNFMGMPHDKNVEFATQYYA